MIMFDSGFSDIKFRHIKNAALSSDMDSLIPSKCERNRFKLEIKKVRGIFEKKILKDWVYPIQKFTHGQKNYYSYEKKRKTKKEWNVYLTFIT